jgi:predicted DCC family thiol-disulfide oxidoreductase YuxK
MSGRIYVLYDARCGLCSRLRVWMTEQRALVDLDFVPAGSERARRLFPELAHDADPPRELVAVTDEGEVYVDDAAWIVCLFALADYRQWSFRLARPPLRRLARGAWELLSSNRAALSRMFHLESDAELRAELESRSAAPCEREG